MSLFSRPTTVDDNGTRITGTIHNHVWWENIWDRIDNLIAGIFGVTGARTLGTAYLASNDGILLIKCEVAGGGTDTALVRINTDGSNPPTTRVASVTVDAGNGIAEQSVSVPIKNGNYYKATIVASSGSPTVTATFYPFGA